MDLSLNIIALIFIGGGLGSVARYLTMNLVSRALPGMVFPWPTLGVNVLGAFAVGILLEILALRTSLGGNGKYFLVTGFLGGYTTFSAFSLETALMLERGDYAPMAAYIAASVALTVIAVFGGAALVKNIM